jgi:hypothetical protein
VSTTAHTLRAVARPLRIARKHDERRSRYWTFKASKAQSGGLYISREGTPGGAHLRLHYDQDWHLKVEGRYYNLRIANTIKTTAVRHAVTIVIGRSACRIDTTDMRVEEIRVEPGDDDVCLVLDVFMASQPGRVFGQNESGRPVPRWEVPLLDGQSAQILARVGRVPVTMTVSVDAPADALEDIRVGVADGSYDHLLVLDSDDDSPVRLMDVDMIPSPGAPPE